MADQRGLSRWDIVAVPDYAIGLGDTGGHQYGLVISSDELRDKTDRYWLVFIPANPPSDQMPGDVEVPYLTQVLGINPAIIRTATIFAVHREDLVAETAAVELQKPFRRKVQNAVERFLPRRV